jgi:cytochrome P450
MRRGQVTLDELAADPHPVLARLRATEPVAWIPALGAWLVTGYGLAAGVLRDARTFTVDDPRFSTARVVGPSMLSLDGARHAHHRGPFGPSFRAEAVHARLTEFTQAETGRLIAGIQPGEEGGGREASRGEAELRRSVAGPLAAAVIAEALGLGQTDPTTILAWYDEIVAATTAQAGPAAAAGPAPLASGHDPAVTSALTGLAASLRHAIAAPSMLAEAAGSLTEAEVISNAAVLMFGAIETTEGMITNAVLHLLASPAELAVVQADPALLSAAIEESLRLEPAAAVVDRYATRETRLGDAVIAAGDQVTVSISGASRDPAVFQDPDRYLVRRANAGRHLAFAHGPHFCLGAHLARLEAEIAVAALLDRLPGLRLDPRHPSQPRGLIFRKPPDLHVCWGS